MWVKNKFNKNSTPIKQVRSVIETREHTITDLIGDAEDSDNNDIEDVRPFGA